MKIREGKKEDLPQVLELIKELALYEKALHEVDNDIARMLEDGFGEKPVFEFFVAEEENKLIGLALYYYSYSTWKGKCIFLEDLIVTESYRRKGVGKKLFNKVMEKAKETDARRISWQVLEWNKPAIQFYKSLEANLDPEWINCKLTKEQIRNYTKL